MTAVEDLGQARRALAQGGFSFCLTDMRLPDGNGLDLVREIAEKFPDLHTAVITAHGKVEDEVNALKIGAFDFVSKPVDLAVLRKLVNTALRLRSAEPATEPEGDRGRERRGKPSEPAALDRLIGNSPAINRSARP